MSKSWILVAHRGGARIFSSTGARAPLTPVEEIDFPQGRLQAREIDADRPGRAHDRKGGQRHGVGVEQSSTEHLAAEFARSLAAKLAAALEARQFDSVVLVAEPGFLGHLREQLDERTTAAVRATLAKGLGEVTVHDLPAHLEEVL